MGTRLISIRIDLTSINSNEGDSIFRFNSKSLTENERVLLHVHISRHNYL